MSGEKNCRPREKTLEEALKVSMGLKYKRVSIEDRKVIHEMSKCQKMGGPIGSKPILEV